MAKIIRGFLENLFEYYFLNIIVNVNFFSDLKFGALALWTMGQVLFCEFCEISKNTFSYKIPPVAASGYGLMSFQFLLLDYLLDY